MIIVGCVLCDWTFDPATAPLAVYRPGGQFPLRWGPTGPEPVSLADVITETMEPVAVVHHWHVAHHDLLQTVLADYEVDTFPRSHWGRGAAAQP